MSSAPDTHAGGDGAPTAESQLGPQDSAAVDLLDDDEFADGFTTAVTAFRSNLRALFPSAATERDLVSLYDDYIGIFQQALQASAASPVAAQHQERYLRSVREVFTGTAR